MIQGNIKNIASILPYLDESLQAALKYAAATDFSGVANGEYELDGRKLFARVNTYDTEPAGSRRPERHDKYIDVQLVACGREVIHYAPFTAGCRLTEDRLQNDDVAFYDGVENENRVELQAGDFAVFFPWELHRPNCCAEAPEHVQKVVIKVLAR